MRKLTKGEFVDRVRCLHNNKYDYSKVEYVNNGIKVCIICPEHGEFWQLPRNHMRGDGCKACATDALATNKIDKARDNFFKTAPEVHENFYDYSKAVYTKMHEKVCITCPNHGDFWQTPNQHLYNKNGCPKCSGRTPVHPDLSHIETPVGSKAVPVGTKGDYALVDDEDYEKCMEYNWSFDGGGYARNHNIGKMHRFIMNAPNNMDVDHKFHDKLDNRKSQLRICTRSQNMYNSGSRGGASKFKGVYWDKKQGKWESHITVNYKKIFLGYYETEREAALAYDVAANKYSGEFAKLNFNNED